jgi:hypothetical protein
LAELNNSIEHGKKEREFSASFLAELFLRILSNFCKKSDNANRQTGTKTCTFSVSILNVFSRTLTPDNVLSQLKYRYDREVDHCER